MSNGPLNKGKAAASAALEHHLFTLVSSLGRIWTKPVSSLMTIGVVACALALPSALLVGLRELNQLSSGWETLGEMALFLQADQDEENALELADTLRAHRAVAEVVLLSPEDALDDFRQYAEFGDVLDNLPENPLPWVLVLTLKADPGGAATAALMAALEPLASIDFVQYDRAWVARFEALMSIGRRSVQGMGVLLALAVLLIVGNTIRLDIHNRREEIEITKILGATDGFVRRPFLYSGGWYGLLGGLIAWLLVAVGIAVVAQPAADLARSYDTQLMIDGITFLDGLQLMTIGAFIGWLGSWLAVGGQLNKIQPQ